MIAVPILTYHDLRPTPASISVPAARFRAQLDALAKAGYHGVTLSQAWAGWHGGPALPSHPVVITFDDGYASQYTVAGAELRAPALARRAEPRGRPDRHRG